MTRINLVHPRALCDQHLLAEHKEAPQALPRSKRPRHVPASYTLGPGHVSFFHDKRDFIWLRDALVVDEMLRRGMRPRTALPCPVDPPAWQPRAAEIELSVGRIHSRLATMEPQPRFSGAVVSRAWAQWHLIRHAVDPWISREEVETC